MASFIGVQRCRLPGLKPSKPSAQHAPLSHAKVTTRPQQWLKSTPRPQQWLLIGVQGCRLPGLKPSIPSKTLQTLQTLQKSGQLRREKVPQQAQHAPLPHAKATTRPHPTAAAMASYTRSRLPFARPQTFKTLQTLQKSGQLRREKVYPNKPNTRHSRTQKPPQGHSNGSRAPHGRSNGFFYRRSTLPFAMPQTLQTFRPTCARALSVRGSFHQAWLQPLPVQGCSLALCLHIPRGSFHQAPGRQRSSIAACPLPAHSPLLLGHSSLPFARLQTHNMPQTLLCLHIALSR